MGGSASVLPWKEEADNSTPRPSADEQPEDYGSGSKEEVKDEAPAAADLAAFEHEVLGRLHAAWNDLSEVQRSRLVVFVDKRLKQVYEEKCPQPLHVSVLYAFGLIDKDFLFKSDPYIKVKLFGKEVTDMPVQEYRTKTVNNTTSPAWNESFEFRPGATVGSTLQFQVWDDDHRFKDDYLGQLNVCVKSNAFANGFGPYQMLLEGEHAQGSLVFSYYLEPHDVGVEKAQTFEEVLSATLKALNKIRAVDAAAADSVQEEIFASMQRLGDEVLAQRVVVRKEIRTMTEDECERFYNTVCKMMQNNKEDEPESSEFFRLASYHGWPRNFCVHRQESFPTWHRAYMIEFEHALQQADIALGNDGNIGLPYWDFGTYEINGQILPNVARRFESLPEKFFNEKSKARLKSPFYKLRAENHVRDRLVKCDMKMRLQQCLEETNHWRHASNENGSGVSLENPHNQAHVACGYPVSSVAFAAFHPVFYLIHSNVDRYYQKYLELEPDSLEEFRSHQLMRLEKGDDDKFAASLAPFENRAKNEVWTSEAVMCPNSGPELHYVYDSLPQRDPPQMREPPIYAIFPEVDVVYKLVGEDGEMKAFELHIFVMDKAKEEKWDLPSCIDDLNSPELCSEDIQYAGWCGAFPGKGPSCENCKQTKPILLSVDITRAMASLNLSRENAVLKVACVDEVGKICRLEDISAVHGDGVFIPLPKIVGSYFEGDINDSLTKENWRDENSFNVAQLARSLKKYGFYTGEITGEYSDDLEDAVKEYQQFLGIVADGNVGQVMKSALLAPRNDGLRDKVEESDEAMFAPGSKVRWFLGMSPGYMKREEVERATECAILKWQKAMDNAVEFERSYDVHDCEVAITWTDRTEANDTVFDGKGGSLAHTNAPNIEFDKNERWFTDVAKKRRGDEFAYYPVLLHELGHLLGLRAHSRSPKSVMAPFYVENRTELSEEDISRVKALYTLST